MTYPIELEWTGEKRLQWMRQHPFFPCDCKKCYFCVKGHTSGVAHPRGKEREVVYTNEACVRANECVDVGVKISDNTDYCRMSLP